MIGIKPRLGVVSMVLPGYYMGEEMCEDKNKEAVRMLKKLGYDVVAAPCAYSPDDCRKAGEMLLKKDVDCLFVFLATFVADYFVTELVKACDRPVFMWALDREVDCITMVCEPLITASLKNLYKDCCVVSGEIGDEFCVEKLYNYSKAAMLKNQLRKSKFGYSDGKPEIMYSMAVNEYLLDQKLGVTIVNMPVEDFYKEAETIDPKEVKKVWNGMKGDFGCVDLREGDGELSIRYYMAAKSQVVKKGLKGYSLNCFPNLKAQICLPIAMLNDELIGAGCEGDLHSTILMTSVGMLTGKAAFNGDFLQLNREQNVVTFSHCGAGALTLAGCRKNISLMKSQETEDGLGVFYKTQMPGKVTLVNLMNGGDHLRLSVMCEETVEDPSGYYGNPLALKFSEGDVRTLPDVLAQAGTGHHWTGMTGDWVETFRLFARMTGIQFTHIKPE